MDVLGPLCPPLPKKPPGRIPVAILQNTHTQVSTNEPPKRPQSVLRTRKSTCKVSESAVFARENMASVFSVGKTFCPHCGKWLSRSSFVEHRALYYSKDEDLWVLDSLVSSNLSSSAILRTFQCMRCIDCCSITSTDVAESHQPW